ncbi:MAG: hydrogenase expression/formation protein HypE [Bdellovibrionales bacterium RIFOXYD12_FULL_39_22]|nr:MAG: hydrogenase expression/formation protein HypE [Bdellovibrionales bacterium RIFOXYB1_FULL_39_21]OFZ40727.1 MAG: hydrogenase expression/formation protein HypE [Bdellovibrionales bacterium RIFOXYC12_FULL_39_17]OFZ48149.1 MAG: hydrogenase expression/formation protein HypE [Bdellovibrionales bacterium RIFOXYC1_FULL_39_130]OFZ75799.1 MAG: hydrogenase expression/formation protein HypE [Bdellovibrionales bacterium RIFOXYD1_FULL_39_84]OFZ91860.1 MAG: hydrogenase expression/formation protein HypE
MNNSINLTHGSGGTQMHQFIKERIMAKLGNNILEKMDDAAVMENQKSSQIAMTTDSFVVNPLFFPGGDIGRLAICGTVNDLATSGAVAHALSLAFILEDGILFSDLDKIIDSIATTAKEARIKIVTGDTKVVERGKCDKIFINTTGLGFINEGISISSHKAQPQDCVYITGTMGNHEVALMKARELFDFSITTQSDVAPLNVAVNKLLSLTKNIHTIKDPTRGGVASALREICEHSQCTIKIFEEHLPVDKDVHAVCDLLGLDPLYLANEGKFIIIAPESSHSQIMQAFPQSSIIGEVIKTLTNNKDELLLETISGGMRKIRMLDTMQLPRIC